MWGMSGQGTEDFSGSENTLYDTVMAITCHYTFIPTHRMYNTKMNHNIHYSLRGDCDMLV